MLEWMKSLFLGSYLFTMMHFPSPPLKLMSGSSIISFIRVWHVYIASLITYHICNNLGSSYILTYILVHLFLIKATLILSCMNSSTLQHRIEFRPVPFPPSFYHDRDPVYIFFTLSCDNSCFLQFTLLKWTIPSCNTAFYKAWATRDGPQILNSGTHCDFGELRPSHNTIQ